MEVRDAVEEDADALTELADGPRDVIRNLIHDRSVRIASVDGETVAFVSFDARPGTVYVTQIGGDPVACKRLLEEPVRFAKREGMDVELLVTEDQAAIREAITGSGFEEAGRGPDFEGVPTVKYRHDPTSY
jgi:hypothetical protein